MERVGGHGEHGVHGEKISGFFFFPRRGLRARRGYSNLLCPLSQRGQSWLILLDGMS